MRYGDADKVEPLRAVEGGECGECVKRLRSLRSLSGRCFFIRVIYMSY